VRQEIGTGRTCLLSEKEFLILEKDRVFTLSIRDDKHIYILEGADQRDPEWSGAVTA
jgi:hypothetical protein